MSLHPDGGLPWPAIGTLGGALVSAAVTWHAAKRQDKKDKLSAEQGLIKLAQDAAAEQMKSLREEIVGSREEVRQLREEARALRAEAADNRTRISNLESDLATERKARATERHELATRAAHAEGLVHKLEGDVRQLQQINDSQARVLRANGLDIPDAPPRATEPVLLGEPAT